MIRRSTNEKGEALLNDDGEFGDAAEDIGLAIDDMKNNINAIDTIVKVRKTEQRCKYEKSR